MSASNNQQSLVAAMSEPAFYPNHPAEVELIETHISWVFLAGNRVYKVKKPVEFSFLDYSTLELRRRMCRREVEINSSLAPRTYLKVEHICRDEMGQLHLGGQGEIVEWAVVMVRLPERLMLHHLLERGEIDNLTLRRIAETVEHFHRSAKTGEGVDHHGSVDQLAQNIADNFAVTRDHIGVSVSSEQWHFLKGWFEQKLVALCPVLEDRIARGRVRAGHGDLRAEHLCIGEDGLVVAFDAIEFNEGLRCCDVANEIAFLCMDIASYGFHHFAAYLARTYAQLAGDEDFLEVLPFFMAYRAHVRAKVDGLRAQQLPDGEEKEAARVRAAQHFHLAYVATRTSPLLVLTYGLAGSGKSTVSREASRTLGLHWLRSDVVHKRLQGARPGERLETGFLTGAYTQEAKAKTYVELLRLTEEFLDRGEGVIVDASFGYPYMRDPFMARIKERGWTAPLMQIQVDDVESKRRLDAREALGTDASDATWAIYQRQKVAFVAPDEVEFKVLVEGTLHPQDQLSRLLAAVIAKESGLSDHS